MDKKALRALQDVKVYYPKEVPKDLSLQEFLRGYAAEMEHANITGGNPVTTARIALVHLEENPRYYSLLEKYVEKKGLDGLGNLSTDDMIEFRQEMNFVPDGIQEKIFMDRYDVTRLKNNKDEFFWVLKQGGIPEKYKDRAISYSNFRLRLATDFSKNAIGAGLTRAMSWEEWIGAVKNGYFQSTGDLNITGEKNVTHFGALDDTIYYARSRKFASRDKPNVIIEFSPNRTRELLDSGLVSRSNEYYKHYRAEEPVPAKGIKHLLYVFPEKSFSNITERYGDITEYYFVDVSDELPERMR